MTEIDVMQSITSCRTEPYRVTPEGSTHLEFPIVEIHLSLLLHLAHQVVRPILDLGKPMGEFRPACLVQRLANTVIPVPSWGRS
jgi:hypothetical protein